jgi:hypothetical protein
LRLSWTVVSIALTLGAAVCFGAFVLYGAWIDGRRQKVREHGGHPVTDEHGDVKDEGTKQ